MIDRLNQLQKIKIDELIKLANKLEVENPQNLIKEDLIKEILKKEDKSNSFYFKGTLEIKENHGFLRTLTGNLCNSESDVYVKKNLLKKYALRNGDIVEGKVASEKKEKDKYLPLLSVEKINEINPSEKVFRPLFENLTALYTTEKFNLGEDISARTVDLFSPIGKGQRTLIVSPPKAGKTELLKKLSNGISNNNENVEVMVLLVDERPEEVTDMQRSVNAEVYSSTFDLPAQNHVKVAEIVIEQAKRKVELGKDVVILLDSITRLARAYNTVIPSSGKVLSGGVDANALHKPKSFFGAARNIEEGGSLTIIATALVDTGSKMDEVIFEEFKGTGNSEIVLNRKLSELRIFPAINIQKSGTRKEELLISEGNLVKLWAIRNSLHSIDEKEGVKKILNKINKSKDNKEFFDLMKD